MKLIAFGNFNWQLLFRAAEKSSCPNPCFFGVIRTQTLILGSRRHFAGSKSSCFLQKMLKFTYFQGFGWSWPNDGTPRPSWRKHILVVRLKDHLIIFAITWSRSPINVQESPIYLSLGFTSLPFLLSQVIFGTFGARPFLWLSIDFPPLFLLIQLNLPTDTLKT